MSQQLSLAFIPKARKEHGGSLLKGKRKSKRPISTQKPMHFVLKSSKAHGIYSFANYRRQIENLIHQISSDHQIKLYEMAVNFNHIHLLVRLTDESQYKSWIRLLPAEITKTVGAKNNFFDQRPYSKIVEWGRQFENTLSYQYKNQREAHGISR